MVERTKTERDAGATNAPRLENGPFCHYCIGEGLGEEGKVPAATNGVLCMSHLNDVHLFGFYEEELAGADLTDQLTDEMQRLLERGGFIDRGRAELNATLSRMHAEKSVTPVLPPVNVRTAE